MIGTFIFCASVVVFVGYEDPSMVHENPIVGASAEVV